MNLFSFFKFLEVLGTKSNFFLKEAIILMKYIQKSV